MEGERGKIVREAKVEECEEREVEIVEMIV